MSEPFPMDFASLEKGDVISDAQIQRIYLINRMKEPDKYRLKMLTLRDEIERKRPDLLCRSDGHNIRIMTDEEAEQHTWDRIGHAVRSMGRNAQRRAVIDRSEFSGSLTAVAESRDRAATMLALANRKELAKSEREKRLLLAPKPASSKPTTQ